MFETSSPEEALACRENNIVGPLFCGGLSPAGTVLGEDSRLQRRIDLNHDLRNGTLPLGRSGEEAWIQNCLSRFRIRVCSALVEFEREQSAGSGLFLDDSLFQGNIPFRTILAST